MDFVQTFEEKNQELEIRNKKFSEQIDALKTHLQIRNAELAEIHESMRREKKSYLDLQQTFDMHMSIANKKEILMRNLEQQVQDLTRSNVEMRQMIHDLRIGYTKMGDKGKKILNLADVDDRIE